MFLFSFKPKNLLGIDIGSAAVKIAELDKDGERYELANYAIFSLAGYLKKSDYQVDRNTYNISSLEFAEIIKRSLKEAKIKTRDAYFTVPVSFSFSTLIDFPNIPDKEIAAAVPFEAQKYVPVPIAEVVLDWSIIQSPDNKNQGKQVLLVAVPKDLVEKYHKISKAAGLKLRAIEEETFALARCLVGNDKSSIALIDFGARSANVSIIDNGYIRITNNINIGGAKVTQSIAQAMRLPAEQAEQKKVSLSKGGNQEVQLKGALNDVIGNLVLEVKKIIDSYENKYNRKIEKGILVGGSVELVGFSDYLSNKLSFDMTISSPFARVAHPEKLKAALAEIGPQMAVAVGAAMR